MRVSGVRALAAADVRGVVVRAALPNTGTVAFAGSAEAALLNRVQRAVAWSQRSNSLDIPTDVTMRDERLGWTGSAGHVNVEQHLLNFAGAGRLLGAWLELMAAEQALAGDGSIPAVVPALWPLDLRGPLDPNWGASWPATVWALWQYGGNAAVARRHLPRLVRYLESMAPGLAVPPLGRTVFGGFGDWMPPPGQRPADRELMGVLGFIESARQVAALAGALGNTSVERRLARLANDTAEAANRKWMTAPRPAAANRSAADFGYASSLQTELAYPLYVGVIPPEHTAAAVQALVTRVAEAGYHPTTGFVGVRALFEALSMHNRTDVALRLALQPSYPSYLWMVANPIENATTLWEQWDCATHPRSDATNCARNTPQLASIGAWFYKYVAGITPAAPGFRRVSVSPAGGLLVCGHALLQGLNATRAAVGTPAGVVAVAWALLPAGAAALNVTVPAGATAGAVVRLGCGARALVAEHGVAIWSQGRVVGRQPAITGCRERAADLELELAPGRFVFAVSVM